VQKLFILFMMVLLPLRGWAGDFMSVQMATSQTVVQVAAATQNAPATQTMAPGCPMHPQAAPTQAADPDQTTHCTSCDLCTPVAQLPETVRQPVVHGTEAQPRMRPASFASAALAPTVKPPIF
jgi:hypothetical protein